MPPTIASPLRLLIFTAPDTPEISCFKGSTPQIIGIVSPTQAYGQIPDVETYNIQTPYYNASIPIWRDTLPLDTPTIMTFKSEWQSLEAAEVIQAVGAWIVYFKKPKDKRDLEKIRSLLTAIHAVIEHHASGNYGMGETLMLAIGMHQSVSPSLEMEGEEWEDLCRECGGWEWIDGEAGEGEGGKRDERRDEFGGE